MKKHANQKPTDPNEIPFGVWVQKGGFDHLYGSLSVALNMKDRTCYLKLDCDCGVEQTVLGMNLETLKKVCAGMAKAIIDLEHSSAGKGVKNVH